MNSIIFAKTMRDVEQDLQQLNLESHALLGHFNSRTHELYASKYLVPQIEKAIVRCH